MESSPRRLVVLEANEIPLRVVLEHARREPDSAIARIVRDGGAFETEVREETGRRLYPSQTWYSLNSGVPYSEHRVFWYGDPKPADHPLYWQVAARAGRRVGLVNTLHSSPLRAQCDDGDFAFVIPDCFADDAETSPGRYERFQAVNLALTKGSGRRASVRPSVSQVGALATLPALGVRPATFARLGALAAGIATKRQNKERLRGAQAMLLADMFSSLCRRADPDLAVMFTNHVASAMHRYWYALFPDDFGAPLYDPEWVERYADEVPAAMRLLDRMVGEALSWCEATDRTLVVLSSMGQSAAREIDATAGAAVVVRDPVAFARVLGITAPFELGSAMVPQIHYDFATGTDAAHQAAGLRALDMGAGDLEVDLNGSVVTITYHLGDGAGGTIVVGGRPVTLDAAGAVREAIDDHRSGDHDPRGAMLVANSPHLGDLPPVIDALDVAPMLLETLGVAPAPGMRIAARTL